MFSLLFCVAGLFEKKSLHAEQKQLLRKAAYDHRTIKRLEKEEIKKEGAGIVFVSPGTKLGLSGALAQEHVAIRNGNALNEEVGDWKWKFRQRIDLKWHSEFFGDNKKKPAAEAVISFLNMHFWKESYSNLYLKTEPAFLSFNESTGHFLTPDNSFDQVSNAFFEPMISSHIPVITFTEAWFSAYFHRYVKALKKKPTYLKVGYFPYQLGRGIALGPSDEGGIEYFGYNLSALPFASPFYAPGILWHGTVTPHVAYELYYSLLLKRYNAPFERDALYFRFRLDKAALNRFGKEVASQLWAGKVIVKPFDVAHKSLYSEGYFLWHHATLNASARNQNIVDRDTDVVTLGCMLDCRYKQLRWNLECATQLGAVVMHPFDKNDLRLRKNAQGFAEAACTHVRAAKMKTYDGTDGGFAQFEDTPSLPAPATDALLSMVNDDNLGYSPSNVALHDASGNTIIDLMQGNFINKEDLKNSLAALWNGGAPIASAATLLAQAQSRYIQCYNAQDRVRNQFKVELQGFMCTADLAYAMKKFPCSLHLAGAFISGDTDPFAAEKNTSYKGFLPIRDIRYRGHFVKSLAVLGARVIPRPCDGQWHQQDASNLAYAGVGFQVNPLEDRSKLLIESNVLWFFQPAQQKKALLDSGTEALGYAHQDLGVECNASLTFRPLKSLVLLARGGIFFPGKLYKDREAQMMQLMTTSGTLEKTKIGIDLAWGYHLRLAYSF